MKKEVGKTPKTKVFGTIGFIFSLIGLVSLLILNPIFSLIFGIIGLILCIVQYKKGRTGLAKAGMILSIIAITLSVIIIIANIIVFYSVKSAIESNADKLNQMAENVNNLP